MRKLLTIVAMVLMAVPATIKAQNDVNIGKSNIKLNSRMMTPEALWAMGRIGTVEASPDGRQLHAFWHQTLSSRCNKARHQGLLHGQHGKQSQ